MDGTADAVLALDCATQDDCDALYSYLATMYGLAILIMEQQIPPVVGDPEAAAGLTRSVLRTLFDGLASR